MAERERASSANAKKWEVELATLKSNNLRLTAALQESTANVDEWKRQLHQYREEVARARHIAGKVSVTVHYNLRLTAALQESTANVDEWKRQLHQYREEVARARHIASKGGDASEVEQLRQRVAQLEAELAQKNEELAQITKSKKSEQDAEAKLAQSQLELALAAHEGQKQVLQALNDQFARQLQHLSSIHKEINTALQT
ncbi:unnamed protein product [Plutella xylostella]|uniref:(diamondback moth) hypothetical protein n=1 Tax=Plutella xylostella TaxID=51655 RepID=A0A8S4G6C0_PLUXY|nr:unnamed protein product [Plutella xylostella]